MKKRQEKDWIKLAMSRAGSGISVLSRQTEIEQTQRVMRVGRKHNAGPVFQPPAEPYYRQLDKRR